MSLGAKIREVRQAAKLTLKNLSDKTGLTASYISQVERSIIEPSIYSLRRISAALEMPIHIFLTDENTQNHVLIRANERKKLDLPHSSIIYEFITPMASDKRTNPKMEVIYLKLEPKSWSSSKPFIHAADEWIFMIEGEMDIFLGTDKYTLKKGDSIYIQENIPHRFYNPGTEIAIAISAISPIIY